MNLQWCHSQLGRFWLIGSSSIFPFLFLALLAVVHAASIREAVDKEELENIRSSPEVVLEYGQAPTNSNIYKRNKRDNDNQEPEAELQYLQPIENKSMPSNMQSRLSMFAFFRGKKSQNIVVEDNWICSPIQDVWN